MWDGPTHLPLCGLVWFQNSAVNRNAVKKNTATFLKLLTGERN